MKPKFLYLLDENVSSNKNAIVDSDSIRAVDYLGRGASDDQVLELAQKTKTIIVTKDKKFIVQALGDLRPVVDYNRGIIIRPKVEKYVDMVTAYLEKTKGIVIP